MTRNPRRVDTSRGEDGSALVMALVVVMIVSVYIGAILTFAQTSFISTRHSRDQRGAVYSSDGAINNAIQAMRADGTNGRYGSACTVPSLPATNGVDVAVTCTPQAGSGEVTGPGIGSSSANTPQNAILTLSGTENGIVQSSINNLRVRGPVFSNSNIASGPGAFINLNSTNTARQSCTGTITPACSVVGTASRPDGDDPLYPIRSDAPAVPGPVRDLSTQISQCADPNPDDPMLIFEPGMYSNVAQLNTLTGAASQCPKALLWFKPGNYYFDSPPGSSAWVIAKRDVNIVGGEAKGWSPTAAGTKAPSLPSFGSRCKNEIDGAGDGVQFVFGRESRFEVQAGSVELCAQRSATEQQIAIYGASTSTTQLLTGRATAFTGLAGFLTADAPKTYRIGETPVALASYSGSSIAQITLQKFNLPTLPAGSVIDSVILRIAHAESPTANNGAMQKIEATVIPGDGSSASLLPVSTAPGMRTDEFDVTTALNSPAKLSNVQIKYVAEPKNRNIRIDLDGIELEVVYSPLSYRSGNGCIKKVYVYGDGVSCALITTRGTYSNLMVRGTVYAPLAAIDIELTKDSYNVFRRGVISRVLRVTNSAASGFSGAAIELPDASGFDDRVVVLYATIGGKVKLKARVRFVDRDGTGAQSFGHEIKVLRWQVVR